MVSERKAVRVVALLLLTVLGLCVELDLPVDNIHAALKRRAVVGHTRNPQHQQPHINQQQPSINSTESTSVSEDARKMVLTASTDMSSATNGQCSKTSQERAHACDCKAPSNSQSLPRDICSDETCSAMFVSTVSSDNSGVAIVIAESINSSPMSLSEAASQLCRLVATIRAVDDSVPIYVVLTSESKRLLYDESDSADISRVISESITVEVSRDAISDSPSLPRLLTTVWTTSVLPSHVLSIHLPNDSDFASEIEAENSLRPFFSVLKHYDVAGMYEPSHRKERNASARHVMKAGVLAIKKSTLPLLVEWTESLRDSAVSMNEGLEISLRKSWEFRSHPL